MSAKNWRVCPRCVRYAKKERERQVAQAKSNYGVIPAEQWINEFNAASEEVMAAEGMREDYDIGLDEDGKFVVSYRASCEACGFEFKHGYNTTVVVVPPS